MGSYSRTKEGLIEATASLRGWLYSQAITANFRVNARGGWEKLAVMSRNKGWLDAMQEKLLIKRYKIMSKYRIKYSVQYFDLDEIHEGYLPKIVDMIDEVGGDIDLIERIDE